MSVDGEGTAGVSSRPPGRGLDVTFGEGPAEIDLVMSTPLGEELDEAAALLWSDRIGGIGDCAPEDEGARLIGRDVRMRGPVGAVEGGRGG